MGITLVPGGALTGVAAGGNVSISLPPMLRNDVVVVIGGFNGATLTVPSGYSTFVSLSVGPFYKMRGLYKAMGVVPDAQVNLNIFGGPGTASTWSVLILRGVNIELGVIGVTIGTIFTSDPGAAGTTTTVDGAWAITCVTGLSTGVATAAPSGYTNFVTEETGGIAAVAIASKEVPIAGVESPGNWTMPSTEVGIVGCNFAPLIRHTGLVGLSGNIKRGMNGTGLRRLQNVR